MKRTLCAAALLCVTAAGCRGILIDFAVFEDTVVNLLSLTALVIAPVKDAAPVGTAINTAQYTGSVAWQTGSGKAFSGGAFARVTVYRALVTLMVKDGYTFTGVAANSFTYSGAAVTNEADSGTVTITFPATADGELETGDVTVEFDGLPQDEAIEPAGALSWVDNDTLTVTVGGAFSAYVWYVDGVLLDGQTGAAVSLSAQDYPLGEHTVSVRVSATDGASYVKTARFIIVR
jgi:hypothetical protein